jgi:hypothetical protein
MSNYLKIDINPHDAALCGQLDVALCGRLNVTSCGQLNVASCGRLNVTSCGQLNVAPCGQLHCNVAPCSQAQLRFEATPGGQPQVRFEATPCGQPQLIYDVAQCGHTHSRSAYNGSKEILSLYQQIKSKYWPLEKNKRSSFEKNMQPLTINKKFNYFIFLSDNMALYYIDDDFVKKILRIAFIS